MPLTCGRASRFLDLRRLRISGAHIPCISAPKFARHRIPPEQRDNVSRESQYVLRLPGRKLKGAIKIKLPLETNWPVGFQFNFILASRRGQGFGAARCKSLRHVAAPDCAYPCSLLAVARAKQTHTQLQNALNDFIGFANKHAGFAGITSKTANC